MEKNFYEMAQLNRKNCKNYAYNMKLNLVGRIGTGSFKLCLLIVCLNIFFNNAMRKFGY